MRKILYGVCISILLCGNMIAEDTNTKENTESTPVKKEGVTEKEKKAVDLLPDEKITATRLNLDPIKQPYAFYRHDRDDLNNNTGRTALDRIDYGPGVIMQHTAPGQTSPYIRGLTGKQSLLLFNGVRLSHATMRGGPNQYSAFIPDMSIENIDIILGSSGVVTGSDGLTGALDLRLATPGRGVDKPASVSMSTRLDSANGVQGSTGLDGKAGNWRYTVEGSFYDFHDTIGGKGASEHTFGDNTKAYDGIPNTAYDQWAFAGRVAYDGFADQTIELALGHTNQRDSRRPDGYFENSGADSRISRYYDPETFTYLQLHHEWTPAGGFVDKLSTSLWWHQQDEMQKREDLASSNTVYRLREYDDRIDSIGFEPQATSLVGSHEITYGAFVLFESTSNAYREYRNLNGVDPAGMTVYKPEGWDANTTITDGAKYNTYAIYAQDLWNINDQWSILAGLRYTFVEWDFDVASSDASDFTGSLRTSWQFHDNMQVFAGISKSFRAPNLNDLDGATDRASSGTITFGNPNLDPEIAYTFETGWRYTKERDFLSATLFYTILDDVIQTVYAPGDTTGAKGNGESAKLKGFELQWDYGLPLNWLDNRLALFGSLSYIDTASDTQQPNGSILEEPISRANRIYGLAGLRYDINENWWTKAQTRFHDAYDEGDVTAGDSGDVRLTIPGNADGTVPGFGVFDLAAGWKNNNGRWLSLTLENLANKNYRQLGSGSDAPGFNVVLAGGIRF